MASAAMVVYCFDTLQSHFDGGDEPTPSFDVQQEYPLFVTWEIEEQGGTHLRGCIGTLAPTRLRNLRDFTFKSALKDRRFDPIAPQEFHRLHCSVSLLIDYEEADSYYDWEVRPEPGATGGSGVQSLTCWDHLQTVTSLMKKAGFRRSIPESMLKAVKVTRYRSSIHKLTYQQY
ncbi:hypothetical protein BBJ28_00019668, partial [Nothophytophthora sp. Chile5]